MIPMIRSAVTARALALMNAFYEAPTEDIDFPYIIGTFAVKDVPF